jgi:hypothetical protein
MDTFKEDIVLLKEAELRTLKDIADSIGVMAQTITLQNELLKALTLELRTKSVLPEEAEPDWMVKYEQGEEK